MKKIVSLLFIISLGLRVFAQPSALANFVIKYDVAKIVCFQSTVEFENTSTDSTINTYVWDFGDGSKKDTVYSLTPNMKHTYLKDGKYSVSLTIIDTSNFDTVLAQKKRTDVIKIYRPNIVGFSNKSDDFETFNVTFKNSEEFKPFDPTAWTFVWDFGDGYTEPTDSSSIFHHFKEKNFKPGYNVTLRVQLKDEIKLSNNKTAECFDTVTIVVPVKDGFFKTDSASNDLKPLIPNIFTPNGDGQNEELILSMSDTTTASVIKGNDVFAFKTNGEQMFSIWIYNRWGQLVYKNENKTIVWNGKSSSGDDLNSGVYYYVIESNASDKRHNTQGVIHLFRE